MDRKLHCDMKRDCSGAVTHIDEKGYGYCAVHGEQRKLTMRCRKLSAAEVGKLERGESIERY